jgi:NAD(P)H-dependent flavin oxidoreductase YrpB (nitropropane dioxygenase family)
MSTEMEEHKDMKIADTAHIEVAQDHLDPEAISRMHRHGAKGVMDEAARILQEAGGHVEYTPDERRRLLRRIDIYVCIPMCLTYFIQQVRARFVARADL